MAQLERLAERLRVRIAEVESTRDAMAKLEGRDSRDAFQRDCGELAGLRYAAAAVAHELAATSSNGPPRYEWRVAHCPDEAWELSACQGAWDIGEPYVPEGALPHVLHYPLMRLSYAWLHAEGKT